MNIVTGQVSSGQVTVQDRMKIDIDFVVALMGVSSPERFFHSRGIIMEKFHFCRNRNSQIAPQKFDLTDSRFPLPLVFRKCIFDATLDLRRARLASLDLTRSSLPTLMLEGAHIDGRLILDGTQSYLWQSGPAFF